MSTANRGFASLSQKRRAEISSLGGKASAAYGEGAHKWDKHTGSVAGRAGGLASAAAKKRRKAAANAPTITVRKDNV